MAAYTYRQKPVGLDPRIWHVVQSGDGLWHAVRKENNAGYAAAAARQGNSPAYTNGPAAPPSTPVTPLPQVAAQPDAPQGPPTDIAQQTAINILQDRLNALRGIYDPRRQALAVSSARGFTDQGLADQASAVAGDTNDQGTTYRLNLMGEGQAQRNQITGNASQYNARGTYQSTARERTDRLDMENLGNARDAMMRRLQEGQAGETAQQAADYQNLSGEQRQRQAEYTQWQSSQAVPPAQPANPEVPAPGEAMTRPIAAPRPPAIRRPVVQETSAQRITNQAAARRVSRSNNPAVQRFLRFR